MAKTKLIARHRMSDRGLEKGDDFTVDDKTEEKFLIDHGFAKPAAAKAAAQKDAD